MDTKCHVTYIQLPPTPPTLLDDHDEDGEPLTYSKILNVWYPGHICHVILVLHAS